MRAIWRKEIKTTGRQVVSLPVGAKILNVQVLEDSWGLWYLCNTKAPFEDRYIAVYTAGQEVGNGTYIGTIQDGPLVFHVFEEDS